MVENTFHLFITCNAADEGGADATLTAHEPLFMRACKSARRTDQLRALYGTASGESTRDATRNYDAAEQTLAAYVQGK